MRTVAIYVNKNWEVEPFLNALTNYKLRPSEVPFPSVINSPKDGDNHMDDYRAVFQIKDTKFVVRCIQDLMHANANPSSSEDKSIVLPHYISQDAPDEIVSVSTAAYPSKTENYNGEVFIMGSSFIYNADDNNPESHMDIGAKSIFYKFDLGGFFYAYLDSVQKNTELNNKFIAPHRMAPENFEGRQHIHVIKKGVAVSDINITNYQNYDTADIETLEAFKNDPATKGYVASSMETTHGVMKWAAVKAGMKQENVLCVSPIVDRLGAFSTDVTNTQNYISAFNAGLTVAGMLALDFL